jgi:hypothetical protein
MHTMNSLRRFIWRKNSVSRRTCEDHWAICKSNYQRKHFWHKYFYSHSCIYIWKTLPTHLGPFQMLPTWWIIFLCCPIICNFYTLNPRVISFYFSRSSQDLSICVCVYGYQFQFGVQSIPWWRVHYTLILTQVCVIHR